MDEETVLAERAANGEFAGRPLVTFALFAYNQEQYVREAIEGAFAQTYSPLEIILSDDCSSDATFAIMQEMAAAYDGPHRVAVRRNEDNQGTLTHVLLVARQAQGQFMVVAAGDDISLPQRTKVMVEIMINQPPNIVVLSSDDEVFDDSGKKYNSEQDKRARRIFFSNDHSWFLGATACFRTPELRRLPMPRHRVLFEDTALMTVFRYLGQASARVELPLIRRRAHSENVGHIRTFDQADIWSKELRAQKINNLVAYAYIYAYESISSFGIEADETRVKANFMHKYSQWPEISLWGRFTLLPKAMKFGYGRRLINRMLGARSYIFLQSLKSICRS
ncbi:MAG: hypothetical protein C0517_00070 [Erythrobacter sp.]|nr:hypothetical protein [Erythrobacter sp.]